MKVIYVNHNAGSMRHGMEFRPYYLAREWTNRGHQVTIVAASFSHVRQIQPEFSGLSHQETIEGISYRWLKTPRYFGNGLGRMINMLCFILQLTLRARWLAKNRPDVVIASSTYPLDIFPCWLITWLARATIIYEVHDLWPLSPIELGNLSKWRPEILAMQIAENFAYRRADAVISVLPFAKAHMVRHGLSPEKFVHIPNGISFEDWSVETKSAEIPEPHREALMRLKASGRFLVGYVGAHGVANALHNFIEAARWIREDQIELVLIGDGPEKPELELLTTLLGLDNVTFLPSVPKAAIPELIRSFDALYIGLKRQRLFRFGVCPNKLLDYLMAGRPIIQAIEAANDLVQASGTGFTVAAEDPEALAGAVRRLYSMNPEERLDMGRNGPPYVLKNHENGRLAEDFMATLNRLVADSPNR